jgi:hypothetical protein
VSSVSEHLDQVVERLAGLRDQLLADELAPDRAARLAVVFESEARAWSQVYELSSLRLVWRAALAAEAGARANAGSWARRATVGQAGVISLQSWVAGRVNAPRPAGSSMSSDRW